MQGWIRQIPNSHSNSEKGITFYWPSKNESNKLYNSVNQIIKHIKNSYLDHWNKETQSQNKLNCYWALNREYTQAEYLFSVRDTKQRRILTKYKLSDHTLAIERGRYKKSWLPKEERICGHCKTGEVETEMHFLLTCTYYLQIRKQFYQKLSQIINNFNFLSK